MSSDLFGRPVQHPAPQLALSLPGADAIERQPVEVASSLPLDPMTVDMFETTTTEPQKGRS